MADGGGPGSVDFLTHASRIPLQLTLADGSTYPHPGRIIFADRQVNTQRSEEHTSELQSRLHLVCRLLLEKKKTDVIRVPDLLYSLPLNNPLLLTRLSI